uniref:ATP synthase complex subunit 8 n=1 Tax=Trigomphus carus TaxID=2588479 RepID=A0A4Y5SDQ4_9ODON|nr:ATP synthase F0 subunit 8 [Trigomphus carus]
MPQMAPMSWLMLFMFFTIMMIMFNMINYYSFTPKITSENIDKKHKIESKNWKW